MKLVRYAGAVVLSSALAVVVLLPGPFASGQSVTETVPNPTYYPVQGANNFYRMNGAYGHVFGSHDPETLKLMKAEAAAEREAAGLIKEYGRVDNEGQRDKIKTKLSDVLGKEFDLQQKRRDLELTRLEAQVKKLRNLMNKRKELRQTIVEKRLDQLIHEAEGLGWTAPAGVALPANADLVPPGAIAPLRE